MGSISGFDRLRFRFTRSNNEGQNDRVKVFYAEKAEEVSPSILPLCFSLDTM